MAKIDFICFRTLGYENYVALLNVNGIVEFYTLEGLCSLLNQFEEGSDQALVIENAISAMKRLKPGIVPELQEDDVSGQQSLL